MNYILILIPFNEQWLLYKKKYFHDTFEQNDLLLIWPLV